MKVRIDVKKAHRNQTDLKTGTHHPRRLIGDLGLPCAPGLFGRTARAGSLSVRVFQVEAVELKF